MFHDFRFGLKLDTAHLTYHYPKCSFQMAKLINWVSIVLGKLNNAIFGVKQTFNAVVCQMCGNHSKTKYEIKRHYLKDIIIFFIPYCRSWDFKPLSEKANQTSLDSSLDKPKALNRNFGSQPFTRSEDDKKSYIKVCWMQLHVCLWDSFKMSYNNETSK